jgi:superfamily II DNA or RNA helicase
MTSTDTQANDQDPFLFDNEQLQALADPSVIRAGLQHFRENRVTRLGSEAGELWAEVEDADSGEPMSLSLSYDGDGNLLWSCTCLKDEDRSDVCVHAIAALFAYAGGTSAELTGALESAIEERAVRGRAEVRVEPLSGDPWYGNWSAKSVTPSSHFATGYQVSIRSLKRRANHCTCPDFATNQLGTCKHIEAVLHRIRKRKDFEQIQSLSPPHAYVFLDWEAERAPVIRLHRGSETETSLSPLLQEHFDARGAYRRRLPEDFLAFADQIRDRTDIDLGEDALGYARYLAETAERQARTQEIRRRIAATEGRLPGIDARLYPYQVDGVAFLAGNGRALLADDMGLGKTLQAISAATWLKNEAEVERVLVVCPASLKQQWAREIHRFSGEEARVIQGPVAARTVRYRGRRGWSVVNYELVMRDLSIINQELRPDLVILDEAQRIKNWRTKVAAAVKRIASRYAFVLSGTPLENRLEDLYSLMQVVDPHVLGPLWRYMVDFHVTDERGKLLGYRNLSELRRRLSPVMLRRDRSLVRDQLPDRIEQRLDLPLTPKQEEIHADALKAAQMLADIMKKRPLTPTEQNRMMAALQRARMACNAAGLVDKETEGSPKLDELENILHELCRMSGLKAVIFSQWELMTQMVEDRVRRLELGCVRLHGGVPTVKRGDLMDRFREDDAVQVFISTDAGGTGLNLQHASVLINLDIPWNPAVLDQRIARVHRLGQSETVQVLLLVSADSYEERVLGLVKGKRHLFDNVVDPEATEEVVSVSKKLAEVLANELAGEQGAEAPAAHAAEQTEGEATEEQESRPPTELEPPTPRTEPPAIGALDLDDQVRESLLRLQADFGPRIERILGAKGGLLVVLDRVDSEDDRVAEDISDRVPVALVDLRTLRGLQRLGAASPAAEAETIFEKESEPREPAEPPLLRKSREKLEAAEVLIRQSCPGTACELLLGALLTAAASRAGLNEPPTPQKAGVWLYSDALPGGQVTQDQAAIIMRAIALAQGAEQIPEPLLRELSDDVAAFLQDVVAQAKNQSATPNPLL